MHGPHKFDLTKYKNITEWMNKCQAEMKDYDEIMETGAQLWFDDLFAVIAEGKEIKTYKNTSTIIMGITLYYMSPSPPSRAVDFLIKELELDAELKQVNLLEKDQLKPEFLALNPTHTIPTLDDNGFVVWDSHAILQYLASKYGKDSTLYPKDPENQATVNNRLFFNATTFFPRMRDYAAPVFWGRSDTFSADQRKLVQESLKWLDGFIESSGGFVAGPTLTIADFAVAASISSVDVSMDQML
ncbi:unnamed protein product [Notodromas monacha]|uniref:Glutathione S-transferase n=1 Tax=Notodromas monacha TaxID=399045 RepID=A0A7R9BK95_9CRUS|nr:unnamed protein product [Notodromas monacha]CAG0916782.1 unnamed protein product [Notodromas monacha]